MDRRQLIDSFIKNAESGIGLKLLVDVVGLPLNEAAVRGYQQTFQHSERVETLIAGARTSASRNAGSYDKWYGGHWVLSILADFPYPKGDERLLPLRGQQLDWLFGKRHQEMISKLVVNGRQRRCASQEGYALFSHLRLGIANERVHDLAEELVRWQWPDGGWNCDKNPETRVSSFTESLIPLRGLITYNQAYDNSAAQDAARKAAEFFLRRRLLWRETDGSLIRSEFARLHYPCYWHYDILFALKVMSEGGWLDDPRCNEALDLLESKQTPDGGFPAESNYNRSTPWKTGYSLVHWGGTSKVKLNPWVTADALTVLQRSGRL
ncbi:MAG: hypothetical protein HPY85_00550 [Anaerolineae bacterium]|nr:hypothetical protein [Anaerolineae bacterium]